MTYLDALNQFNQFIEGLQTFYAAEFAPYYDWGTISNALYFLCLSEDGGEWAFVEPDTEFLNSVLMEHDRG